MRKNCLLARAALPGPRASFDPLTGRLRKPPASWEREKGWGTKTTGLPDLLVFLGVWYTVATTAPQPGGCARSVQLT
jgi:hypothetical protein